MTTSRNRGAAAVQADGHLTTGQPAAQADGQPRPACGARWGPGRAGPGSSSAAAVRPSVRVQPRHAPHEADMGWDHAREGGSGAACRRPCAVMHPLRHATRVRCWRTCVPPQTWSPNEARRCTLQVATSNLAPSFTAGPDWQSGEERAPAARSGGPELRIPGPRCNPHRPAGTRCRSVTCCNLP